MDVLADRGEGLALAKLSFDIEQLPEAVGRSQLGGQVVVEDPDSCFDRTLISDRHPLGLATGPEPATVLPIPATISARRGRGDEQ